MPIQLPIDSNICACATTGCHGNIYFFVNPGSLGNNLFKETTRQFVNIILNFLPPENKVWGKVMFSPPVHWPLQDRDSLWQRSPSHRPPRLEIPRQRPLGRDHPGQRHPNPPGQRPLYTETPVDRDLQDRDSWTEIPLDIDPSGHRPHWTETPRPPGPLLDIEPPSPKRDR